MNFKYQIKIGNWKFEISNYLKLFFIFFLLIVTTSFFFYPIFKGHIPFPGDLLVGNSGPYNSNTYGGYGPGAVPHKAQGPDVIRQLYPWKLFVIESFKNFQVPFWNPYNFSGNPLMANFQSAVFYPLNILFFILPFNDAWTFFIFLIPLLSAFFTFLYLRESEIDDLPSLFAGIVFAFCGYMVVWMEYGNIGHTMLWLPLGLFITEKLIKKFDKHYVLILVIVSTISLLGGYIQGYFYFAVFLSAYFIGKQQMRKKLFTPSTIWYLVSLALPILLTLFQILPTFELFKNSSRGNYSIDTIQQLLNPWWYAITVIVPDFFGNPASRNHWFYGTYIERVSFFGVIPFFFSLYALQCYKKRKEILILAVLFSISFILAFDVFFTKYFYLIPIPVISTTVPTRVLSLFSFSGALLSGFGFHYFLREKEKKKMLLPLACLVTMLIVGWLVAIFSNTIFAGLHIAQYATVIKRNLIFPSVVVSFLLFILFLPSKMKVMKVGIIMCLCLLTTLDLFRFFHKITPFSPKAYVYPETPLITYIQNNAGIYRYWGYGSGYIDTNFQLVDHTYSPNGNDPLHIKAYTEFIEASKDGKLPAHLPRPDASIAPGFGSSDLPNNPFRQKVLNILGVKYIIQKTDGLGDQPLPDPSTFPESTYKLTWQKSPWQIYENTHVAPRAFITTDYVVVPDRKKQFDVFFHKSFDERKTIILEKNPGITKKHLTKNKVSIQSYDPNNAIFETVTDGDALLFLSDTHYPDWKVKIDGVENEVLIANYAFRAVVIPEGVHTVEFYYESQAFKKGLVLSVISAIVVIFCLFFYKRLFIIKKGR